MDLVITESLCVKSLVRIVGIIFTKTLLHMYPIAIEILKMIFVTAFKLYLFDLYRIMSVIIVITACSS